MKNSHDCFDMNTKMMINKLKQQARGQFLGRDLGGLGARR